MDLGAGTPARGGEDLDAYLNVLRAGHRLVYQPRALVWHPHQLDLPGLSRQIHRYGIGLAPRSANGWRAALTSAGRSSGACPPAWPTPSIPGR